MENIVKQIQLVALVIILVSTVIAFGQEMYQMILVQRVTLADLLLLFLYLEVLAMVRVFWESQSIQITLPLFIAITALARFNGTDYWSFDNGRRLRSGAFVWGKEEKDGEFHFKKLAK